MKSKFILILILMVSLLIELLGCSKKPGDVKNSNVVAPLITEASQGHTDKVKELLARGAEYNAKDNNGKSVLKIATDTKNEDVIKILKNAVQ